jgi:hypothetical protein
MDCRRSFFASLAAFFAGLFVGASSAEAQAAGGVRYHRGHRCPRCRRVVTAVFRPGPGPGRHTHRCPGGTLWFH